MLNVYMSGAARSPQDLISKAWFAQEIFLCFRSGPVDPIIGEIEPETHYTDQTRLVSPELRPFFAAAAAI